MANPGQYQQAAEILGHKNAETTRTVYAGLELEATARLVNASVLDDRKINAMRARISFEKRAPGRRP